ncbi:MAG: elongation factor G [Planctomycetota bacterium]
MAKYGAEELRNVTFVGGSDSGKTSLIDVLLYKGGAATRIGKVDDGSSVSDYDPEEKAKKHSLNLSFMHVNHKKCEINLLDTPGYPDFIGEAIYSLYAADTAIIHVNAFSGIVTNTRKLWEVTGKLGMARVISINKIDMEHVDWDKLLSNLKEFFGDKLIPVFLPNATGAGLSSITDCFSNPDSAPEEIKDQVVEIRTNLIDSLVENDEALMERYLEGETLSPEDLASLMRIAIREGSIIPILCTSVEKDLGVNELLDFIVKYTPSPMEGPFRKAMRGEDEVQLNPQEISNPVAFVFKSVTDPYVGKMNYVRTFTGSITAGDLVYNPRIEKTEKVGNVFRMQGKELEPLQGSTVPGDIIVFSKIESMENSDTLVDDKSGFVVPAMTMPMPMVSLAVTPKNRNDEQKLAAALRKLDSEDATFTAKRDPQTAEMIMTGISMLHLETIIGRMKTRFKVEVETKLPKVPLRETIQTSAEGHHKHKKQTGGHGQYGEVKLILEPVERGTGFVFSDEIVGGSIPRQYIPAIEKGIRTMLEKGVIAGYPIVDVKARIIDGSFHDVDSSEASFKKAGGIAFRNAFTAARPVLLEPIVNIEVSVPSKFMGDINSDMNSRRGRIQGMDSMGDLQIIKALVPLQEVQTYSTDLRSITAGEGSYTLEFSHYDQVPAKVADTFIALYKSDDEDD